MKKIGLWVSLVVAVPLFLVGGLLIFVLTLDPNDYRDEISNLAAEQGVELDIRGNLDLKLFPQLVLGINDVQLSGQFGVNQIEAQVQRFGFELKLMPLLQKRLEFRGLNIAGADVVLRQQDGSTVSPESLPESTSDSSITGLPDIFFEQLQLSDSRLALFSADSEPLVITDLSIDGQNINTSGNYFPLQASFSMQPIDAVEFAGPIHFDTELSFSPEQVQLRLNSLSLILRQPSSDMPISAQGELAFDLAAQQILSESLLLNLGSMQLDLDVQAQLQPLLVQASVRSNEFSPTNLLALAGIDLDMSDPNALSSAQIQFDLQASQEMVEITELVLQLDDTELRGQLRADLSAVPVLTIAANLDQLNLDKYLPAETTAGQESDSTSAAPISSHLGSYELSVGELRVKNLAITDVQSRISSSENQIVLEELRGELAGGNFIASSRLGISLQDQAHRVVLDVNNIYIGQVLAAMSGEAAPITGQLSGAFSATSTGAPSGFLTNMLGSGSVSAANLILVGVDVEGRVCDISDRLQRQSLLSNYGAFAESTALDDMTASIEVGDGLAKLTRLDAGIGNIQASATGQMNLESMDYRAAINAVIASEKTSEIGCTVNRYLRNRTLPLTCSGSAGGGQPQCGIDQSFVQGAIQQALTQGLANQLLGTGSADDENGGEGSTETESKPVQQQIIENIFNRLNR